MKNWIRDIINKMTTTKLPDETWLEYFIDSYSAFCLRVQIQLMIWPNQHPFETMILGIAAIYAYYISKK